MATDSSEPDEPTESHDGAVDLGVVLAVLTGGAGIVHLAMVPAHVGGSWIDPIAFAVVGWLQVALALVFLARRGSRAVAITCGAVNVVALTALVWARTVGWPVGSHAGVVEDLGVLDGVTAVLEAAAVCTAIVMVARPQRRRVRPAVASVVAVLAVGLITMGLASPGTAEHGESVVAGVHAHGDAAAGHGDHADGNDAGVADAGHQATMAALDRERCDLGFNPTSYWREAKAMGVDTYAGGAMSMAGTSSAAGPDPEGGRGSVGLDRLTAATSKAATGGEMDAAGVVVQLAHASTDDYRAWRSYMRRQVATHEDAGHDHGGGATTTAPPATTATTARSSASAPDDNGGHGGHLGPQPWVAMTDPAQCVQLAEELTSAKELALSLPTAADAVKAGYRQVTPYVPGIGAHYMKFSEVDGEFHVDRPEMVLYDGNGPDAHVVGLSYYILHAGDDEPTQGFTGPDDHYHRHVGLCTRADQGVIGDSTTTAEECAARGGVKASGTAGWMSHVWVVPGCESPWGVFSGANPVLDDALGESSGQGVGCAGSKARARYDLRPGTRAPTGRDEQPAGD